METTIYSASPLWAFMPTFAGVGLVIVLGVAGLGFAIFRRKETKIARVAVGCAGLFLCAMGALGIGYTALTIMTGMSRVAACAFSSARTSRPRSRGSSISSKTRSGAASLSIRRSASSPSSTAITV